MPKFEKGDVIICKKTHPVPHLSTDIELCCGEVFEVINVDGNDDQMDIKVSGIGNTKIWWTSSEYFEKEKTKMAKKDHMETKSFKIGGYVTAKETFYYEGEKIVKGHRYEISDCGRKDGERIQIDLGSKYWWVPRDKMMPISSSGSAYTGTDVMLKIKDVIYSNPATIVFWDDGSKTVVRCGKGETFDPEKGLAMAISKRVLGSNYAWHGRFNKWLPKNRAEKKDKSKKTKEETHNE